MKSTIRICFVTKEIFGWGKYGGFGSYVRLVGTELVKNGFEVYSVIPRSENQRAFEQVDGIRVFGLPYPGSLKDSVPSDLVARALAPFLYSECRAHIYQSINPSFYTLLAQLASPTAKHLIAFCDLRDIHDWRNIAAAPSLTTFPNRFRTLPIESPIMRRIVRGAHGSYALTQILADKALRMYGLRTSPRVVRQPIEIPKRKMRKSASPLVCFLGRLDPIKRPWLFFDIARQFPGIDFYVMGQTTEPWRYYDLIRPYRHLDNLKFLGWTFGDRKSQILEKSWVLVNTSVHEALPVSFLEAWAHECAVLSNANPEGLVKRFGYWARGGNHAEGLRHLLMNNTWRQRGRNGRHYVETHHDVHSSIKQLIEIYRRILI